MNHTAPILLVHGGAGNVAPDEEAVRLEILEAAARRGHQALLAGASALDGVVEAVAAMEDAPLLNAGTDCSLNLLGQAELDASIMDSSGRAAGIGALQGIKNPIRLARAVAERTDHQLVVGSGAHRLAVLFGLQEGDHRTERNRHRYKQLLAELHTFGGRTTELKEEALAGKSGLHIAGRLEGLGWSRLPELARLFELHSTVGAVALDLSGELAAATSTGGIWLKLPGRVADSAIIGAGTYCTARAAASATGHGEGILRLGLCRRVVELLDRETLPLEEAVRRAVEDCSNQMIQCGVIVVTADGKWSARCNTPHMPIVAIGGKGEILARRL